MKKRKVNSKGASYITKIGVGNVGVDRDDAQGLMGKSYGKACTFCKKAIQDADDLNPALTLAWHKPNFEGKAGRETTSRFRALSGDVCVSDR